MQKMYLVTSGACAVTATVQVFAGKPWPALLFGAGGIGWALLWREARHGRI